MKIKILSIGKKERSHYDPLYKEQEKLISHYANVESIELFSNTIAKAHSAGKAQAQRAYSTTLEPHLSKHYSIALHPEAEMVDSFIFSKLIADKISVQFLIGGAYGFEKAFVTKCDKAISLSALTMGHKIARMVLLEQIYRGLCINHNHPYHK